MANLTEVKFFQDKLVTVSAITTTITITVEGDQHVQKNLGID